MFVFNGMDSVDIIHFMLLCETKSSLACRFLGCDILQMEFCGMRFLNFSYKSGEEIVNNFIPQFRVRSTASLCSNAVNN